MLKTNYTQQGSLWKFKIMHFDEMVATGLGPTKEIVKLRAAEVRKELVSKYRVFPRRHKTRKIRKKIACKIPATQDIRYY